MLFLLFCFELIAQRPSYTIEVKLDTASHELSGIVEITYPNNSQGALDSLGIHLWANAYANKNTTMAKQMLNLGNLIFRNAKDDELGGYQEISFSSPQETLNFHYDHSGQDIGWIVLSKPLLPNEEIMIKASFVLKIPVSFSRIGRTGDAYQLTQWYPHIAVYDLEGWHTMPYLDQGEFYNDFADYKVRITLPSGYTVAATGMLEDRHTEGDLEVWNFSADNVIDFAWFASLHFKKIEKNVEMEDDRMVLLSVYVDTLSPASWDSVILYAERALHFYSDWLGPYPYPHMSVVSAPWSKGGYMEYPMVAQIGITSEENFLDIVIAHEIGHAWLYSILANDERSDPWMDEGVNTFFERKYAQLYYPGYKEPVFPEIFRNKLSMADNDALQHTMIFAHQLRPPASNPQNQSADQYLFSAYLLPAEGLEMMQSDLGPEVMKAMFRQYFQDRQFTHVSPVDLRVSFENSCGCRLSWFFDNWIHKSGRMDYRIKKFKPKANEFTLINNGSTDLRVHVTSYKDHEQVADYWLAGYRGQKIYHLDQRADQVKLFKDVPVSNKVWWRNSVPKPFLPQISIIPKIGNYERNNWSVTPFLGYNVTDGLMVGPVVMPDLLPQHNLKWIIAPLYGLESKTIRGYAEARLAADFPKGTFDKMLISFSVNRFGYNLDTHYLFRDSYLRLSPSIGLRMRNNSSNNHLTQWWKYRYVDIHQYYGEGIDYISNLYEEKTRSYGIHEVSYTLRSDYVIRPYLLSCNTQVGKGFVKFNFNYQQHFAGRDKWRGTWIHAFAGIQPIHDQPKANTNFTLSGLSSNGYYATDYMFDQWLGGRNADAGKFAHQVFIKDAGFKTLATNGISEKWMVASGASVSMPLKIIHLYMDGALYESGITQKTTFSYSGGIALVLMKDVWEVYLPLLESKDIRQSLSYEVRDQWYERICFQANIRLMNPIDVLDRVVLRY